MHSQKQIRKRYADGLRIVYKGITSTIGVEVALVTGSVEPKIGGQVTEGCAIGESMVVLVLCRSELRDGAMTPMEQAPPSLVG